jgi:hypothetical protein
MAWEGRDDEGIDLPLHSPRLSRGAVDGEAVEIHGEDLRQGRGGDHPGDHHVVHGSGDRHAPVGQSVAEVHRPVDRVDEPGDPSLSAAATLLTDEGTVGHS